MRISLKAFYILTALLVFNLQRGFTQLSLFPDLPGWKLSPEIRQFTKSDLFSYIDGAADNFISYDFQKLNVGEYQKDSQGIKAEIYEQSDNDNGFGIYSSERFPDYHFINIGGQAYTSDNVLNMTCGKYYVKLFAETKTEDENKSMEMLARLIADHLDKNAVLPSELAFFPKENRAENADQFINQSFLGYDFLSRAFTADYSVDDKRFKLFLIKADDPGQAKNMLNDFLGKNNQKAAVSENSEITVDDKYNGKIPVILKKNYILGCMNTEEETLSDKYLEKLAGNIW